MLRFSLGTVISLGNLVISRFSGFHLILLNSPGSVVYFWYCGFPWYCDVSLDNLGGGVAGFLVFSGYSGIPCFSGFFVVLWFSPSTVISLGNLFFSRFSCFHLAKLISKQTDKISQEPGNWENAMAHTWYRHFQRNGGLNKILRRQTSRFH